MNEINYKAIQKANELIQITEVAGNAYAQVNQRIKAFRFLYPKGRIESEMISNENGVCVFKAVIYDESGNVLGVGHAYEKENSTFINKTSYIENCETSAVGRALGMCGLGIDTSVASAEEVGNAIKNQESNTRKISTEWRDKIVAALKKYDVNFAEFAKETGLNTNSSEEDFEKIYKKTVANWEAKD